MPKSKDKYSKGKIACTVHRGDRALYQPKTKQGCSSPAIRTTTSISKDPICPFAAEPTNVARRIINPFYCYPTADR
eukprot:scaffold78_cov96-Cylindrotheca_fusiformis.AAC.4